MTRTEAARRSAVVTVFLAVIVILPSYATVFLSHDDARTIRQAVATQDNRLVILSDGDDARKIAVADIGSEKIVGFTPQELVSHSISSLFLSGKEHSAGLMPGVLYGVDQDTITNVALISPQGTLIKPDGFVPDAHGTQASRFLLACGIGELPIELPTERLRLYPPRGPMICVAVTKDGTTAFTGEGGCGIALLHVQKKQAEKQTEIVLGSYDLTGIRPDSRRAAPITNKAIQIGTHGQITGITALHWDKRLKRLFVAVTTNGGVAVLVGRFVVSEYISDKATDGKLSYRISLHFSSVLDLDEELWDDNDFIVAQKSDTPITVPRLTTMQSSTGRSLLVVQGGVGLSATTKKIFALPLVGSPHIETSQGQLFAKTRYSAVGTLAHKNTPYTQATAGSSEQLHTGSDQAARVGGADAPGTITHLTAYGDTVFVSCTDDDVEKRGVFKSTALFSEEGAVIGWSSWEQVLGALYDSFLFGLNRQTLTSWGLVAQEDGTQADTVLSTQWGQSVDGGVYSNLIEQVNSDFSRKTGGVHGCVALPKDTSIDIKNNIIAFLGSNRFALAVTSVGDSPQIDYSNADSYRNFNTELGELDLGIITSCTATRENFDSWFFIGGQRGVAVLSKTNGGGFDDLEDLSVLDSCTFKKIIDLPHVVSLYADGNMLYITTHDGVYAHTLDQDDYQQDGPLLNPTELFSVAALTDATNHRLLFSYVLDNGIAFFSTTAGLYRTVPGKKISDIATPNDLILVSTEVGICSDIMPIKSSPGSDTWGNVYVLSSDMSVNISVIYRLALNGVDENAEIGLITRLDKRGFVRNELATVGTAREHCYTDGAFWFDGASVHHAENRIYAGQFMGPHMEYWQRAAVVTGNAFRAMSGKVAVDQLTGALFLPTNNGLIIRQ